jgi:hypothetical protein
MKIKIYLAGPLGFSEAGREFHYRSIIPAVKKLGYAYYDPWTTKLDKKIHKVSSLDYGKRKRNEWYKLNFEIGKLNTEGSTVNLQVEYFIRSSGGTIVKTIKQLNTELKKLKKI